MWKISADTGGTFTDCLAETPSGEIRRIKVLSSGALSGRIVSIGENRRELKIRESWDAPDQFVCGFSFSASFLSDPIEVSGFDAEAELLFLKKPLPEGDWTDFPFLVYSGKEAPVLAAHLVSERTLDQPLPEVAMRLATTRATNALLEKKGAEPVFFVTSGFADLLRIGNQQRPDLFALDIERPRPLHVEVIEVDERLDSSGKIVRSLDIEKLEEPVRKLRAAGRSVAAIAFLHSYLNPDHEEKLRRFLLEKGFEFVSCSHELAPMIKLLPRAETAVVDGYLSPVTERYLDRVEKSVGKNLRVMTSAGGLVARGSFRASDGLLSGPAGGVVGAAAAGRAAGFSKIISFDMGGTSSDVARFDGDFEYSFEQSVGDAHLFVPTLKIETVASGGGSICSFDGGELRVGPESAGASPGPACYGGGGPFSLTDVHLLLGRIDIGRFAIPVFPKESEKRFSELRKKIEESGRKISDDQELLEGFLTIANERMADAIRKISLREGYDPGGYALVAFGGAGGLHACAVSDRLGIRSILWPRDAGILSAVGLRESVIERFAQRQVLRSLAGNEEFLDNLIIELGEEVFESLENEEKIPKTEIVLRQQLVELRLRGQESGIVLGYQENLAERFVERYLEIFGYFPKNREIEIVSARLVGSVRANSKKEESFFRKKQVENRRFSKNWPLFDRVELKSGDFLTGPAVIQDEFSTFVVENGWSATVGDSGTIRIDLAENGAGQKNDQAEVVQLELYTNRLSGIAEEMGVQLQRTALSTNIRERLDFSCAILDSDGFLVVNAPHVPVHLGALGLCVREVMKRHRFRPGDMILTNHPGIGGSHLPDLTLIAPVFVEKKRIGFVANRAHHAEMGGIRPGSMPPDAKSLAEEGVVISPVLLFDRGVARFSKIEKILAEGPWPSRAIEENLADLQAQAAANFRGVEALVKLAEAGGGERLEYYLSELKRLSAQAADSVLAKFGNVKRNARHELDDGFAIEVTLERVGDRSVFDFEGTSPEHPGSFNATPAIVQSAVLYLIRLLVGKPIPLNEGLLEKIEIRLPRGLLNPVFSENLEESPAVVAGNVETSQRLVDTLLLAFRAVACSQGTMNNFVFGNENVSFYETICGGAGAGEGFDGESGVHTHMTNTAITDPEILEFRYPVRLERFALRAGSGGEGLWRGGEGVIREFHFLEPVEVSLLTQHRVQKPYGLNGGGPGALGRQRLIRADGDKIELSFSEKVDIRAGDRILIETPGGGGWGEKVL